MKLEMKKEYMAPEMEVVEMGYEAQLLQDSLEGPASKDCEGSEGDGGCAIQLG